MQYKGHNCEPEYLENKQMYYGTIDGLRGAPIIKAPSLESFTERFHDVVDNALAKSAKRTRVRWIAIGAAVLFVIVAAVTVPGKEKHMDALANDMMIIAAEVFDQSNSFRSDAEKGLVKKALPIIYDSRLDVTDCFLFSIGRWQKKNGKHFVSFGILGHVFVIPINSLREVLKGTYDEPVRPQYKFDPSLHLE